MSRSNNLKTALEETMDEMVFTQIPEMDDYVFSRRFNRTMKKLIRSMSNKNKIDSHKESITASRRIPMRKFLPIIIAAVLALFATLMSITAFRGGIGNFFMEKFSTHSIIRSTAYDNAPTTLEHIYTLPLNYDEYKQVDCFKTINDISFYYESNDYQIIFTQTVKEAYKVSVNTEGFSEELAYVNSKQGIYINMTRLKSEYLVWDNGDYIMEIIAIAKGESLIFGKSPLIRAAESVKNAEK